MIKTFYHCKTTMSRNVLECLPATSPTPALILYHLLFHKRHFQNSLKMFEDKLSVLFYFQCYHVTPKEKNTNPKSMSWTKRSNLSSTFALFATYILEYTRGGTASGGKTPLDSKGNNLLYVCLMWKLSTLWGYVLCSLNELIILKHDIGTAHTNKPLDKFVSY